MSYDYRVPSEQDHSYLQVQKLKDINVFCCYRAQLPAHYRPGTIADIQFKTDSSDYLENFADTSLCMCFESEIQVWNRFMVQMINDGKNS